MNKKTLAVMGTVLIIASLAGSLYWMAHHPYREAELNLDVSFHSFHVTAWVKRAGEDGWQFVSHHAGVLTTIGANWIEDQLGDSPSTDPAKWVSVSTSSSSPSAAWTQIPTEIASGGLTRAAGTYASTGDGAWTITVTFTSTTDHTDVQLTGLQWASSGDNNLLASDVFTPVTLGNGDQLTVEWSDSVS